MTFDITWPMLALALVVFGFAPGLVLRLIVLAFPKKDLRRKELLGELHAVPRVERPFWVAEQLEIALFEGLGGRFTARRMKRTQASISDTVPVIWRRTSASETGASLEVAFSRDEGVRMRTSNDLGPMLQFSTDEWAAFVGAVKCGEFDSPADD